MERLDNEMMNDEKMDREDDITVILETSAKQVP